MTELEALRGEIDELRYELQEQRRQFSDLLTALRHLAANVGSSPAAAGAYVNDVLLA